MKFRLLDGPPPGAGLMTVTSAAPAAAISLAEMAALSSVLLTKVVVRSAPFHCTAEPKTKFDPLTVRMKFGPPAAALLGESAFRTGKGLSLAAGGRTKGVRMRKIWSALVRKASPS